MKQKLFSMCIGKRMFEKLPIIPFTNFIRANLTKKKKVTFTITKNTQTKMSTQMNLSIILFLDLEPQTAPINNLQLHNSHSNKLHILTNRISSNRVCKLPVNGNGATLNVLQQSFDTFVWYIFNGCQKIFLSEFYKNYM